MLYAPHYLGKEERRPRKATRCEESFHVGGGVFEPKLCIALPFFDLY